MEKILVMSGPFAGFVGELVNGSVVIEIFGRECNIGRPVYTVQDTSVHMPVSYIGEQFAHLSVDIDKMMVG